MRTLLIPTIILTLCLLGSVRAQEGGERRASRTTRADISAAIVEDLFMQYVTLRIVAEETNVAPRMHATLDDFGTVVANALGLLDRVNTPKAFEAIVFANSLAVDGALAEDLVCSVLSKGRSIKPTLMKSLGAKRTPCESAAQRVVDKAYVDQQTFVGKLCKSRSQYQAWIRNLIDRIEIGDQCAGQ